MHLTRMTRPLACILLATMLALFLPAGTVRGGGRS